MDKKRALALVNALLALVFLMTAGGGLARYFFPDSVPYSTFRAFHPVSGMLMVVLVGIHLYLNSNWIKMTYFKKK